MRLKQTSSLALAFAVLLGGCGQVVPATPPASADTLCPKLTPAQVMATSAVAVENDRVCKSMYGLPCNALTHMLGPMNAELSKETRACVNETVSVYVSGKWAPDNKYQDPKTGKRYGDHCFAVSL